MMQSVVWCWCDDSSVKWKTSDGLIQVQVLFNGGRVVYILKGRTSYRPAGSCWCNFSCGLVSSAFFGSIFSTCGLLLHKPLHYFVNDAYFPPIRTCRWTHCVVKMCDVELIRRCPWITILTATEIQFTIKFVSLFKQKVIHICLLFP